MLSPVPTVKQPTAPAKVKQPKVAAVPPTPPVPSPMARAPVAKTNRVMPSVKNNQGRVVRTDTHNQANQLPFQAKHRGRGKP